VGEELALAVVVVAVEQDPKGSEQLRETIASSASPIKMK
jgi:hypothetical protein